MKLTATPRDPANEDEAIALVEVGNLFYRAFSQLVGQHLSMVDPDLRPALLSRLQDSASCYGSQFEQYLTSPPPDWCEKLVEQHLKPNTTKVVNND